MTAHSMRQYRFQENEPLDGRQMVTVKDTVTGKTIWSKTRDLEDDEIVSTVFDSLHNPRWRIHRPTKGWYLILQRRPDEPYIELKPASKSASASSTSASSSSLHLVFTVQTPLPAPIRSSTPPRDGRNSPSVRLDMSPPPPNAASSSAMSPSLSSASAASSSTAVSATSTTSLALDPEKTPTKRTFSPSAGIAPPAEGWQSTTFRLQPFIPDSDGGGSGEGGLLSRLKGLVAEPKKRWSIVWEEEAGGEGGKAVLGRENKVVLTFEEQSSGFFNPHLTGVLSLSPALIDASGLEPSFWVALCCAYADVLEEKDGWEAAKEGD